MVQLPAVSNSLGAGRELIGYLFFLKIFYSEVACCNWSITFKLIIKKTKSELDPALHQLNRRPR